MSLALSDIAPLRHLQSGDARPIVIAGPCSAETCQQTIATAGALQRIGVKVFRAGVWKPRTMPGGFEGVGDQALSWLQQVKQTTGMLVATEVATAHHVAAALAAGVDVLWLGARTSANPFAVQEIADALQGHRDVTVLVKNPVNPDLDLWLGALHRLARAGVTRLGAVHRGFSMAGRQPYRNDPQWHIAFELRRNVGQMTLLCDPSHLGGRRDFVAPLAQQALDMGFDGLMIECHCNPSQALSDARQQITPAQLDDLLRHLTVRTANTMDEDLQLLRQQIDDCDHELLAVLARRMGVSRQIGEYKRQHNMQVLQPRRYDDVIRARLATAALQGLSQPFVERIMQAIHEESVKQQLDDLPETTELES